MPRLRLIAKGSVQGVGFRFFASRAANGLGLKGFVRNLDDRSVEIIAEGSREALERLAVQIKEGPMTANVGDVKEIWGNETGEFKTFEARF